jgi:hypothetical protein
VTLPPLLSFAARERGLAGGDAVEVVSRPEVP